MKIIKMKLSDLYEKILIYTCHFSSSERSEQGKFWLYFAYSESENIYTHALLKSKQWKPNI